MNKLGGIQLVLAASLGLAGGVGCKAPVAPISVVTVDGSSTVFPISKAVAAEFERVNDARVSVAFSGTGGGFRKFCAGEVDVSSASRPIHVAEAQTCANHGISFIEVPIGYDGLAVLVNPENDWASDITTAELEALWATKAQGVITKWNQVRDAWPAKDIHLFGAGSDSGTYDYFTETILHQEGVSRRDYQASEDDYVIVDGIASDPLALGFFGFAYYSENRARLKVLGVDDGNPTNGAGPIVPSKETVRNGTYQPLSRPLFIYVAERALERKEAADFVTFYVARAPRIVDEVAYLPLPQEVYALARQRLQRKITGSVFHGTEPHIGVAIEALLAKQQAAPAVTTEVPR